MKGKENGFAYLYLPGALLLVGPALKVSINLTRKPSLFVDLILNAFVVFRVGGKN